MIRAALVCKLHIIVLGVQPGPKSDQHLISPHNFTPQSCFMVMRIKEIITN